MTVEIIEQENTQDISWIAIEGKWNGVAFQCSVEEIHYLNPDVIQAKVYEIDWMDPDPENKEEAEKEVKEFVLANYLKWEV